MDSVETRTEGAELRELARQVAEMAASPAMEGIRRRWREVNALRRPDRAPVWCRPVGAWGELLPEDSLRCRTPWRREVERELRMILIKREIGDDTPVNPWWAVPAVLELEHAVERADTWGVHTRHRNPEDPGGSWAFDPPLHGEEDFARLRLPRYTFNAARTEERLARLHDLFGDLLPVRRVGRPPLNATLGTEAAELRGLTQMMLDMALAPHLLHRLLAHLRDGVLGAMRQVQEMGILTPNHTGPLSESLYSEPLAPESSAGAAGYDALWGLANSQEFDQVSPAMWEEFCLAYQKPILAQYGLVSYGCCENLTHKIDGVLSIPNLRVFVCSAWTNLDRVIEKVGRRHVIMWRQKASEVVFPDDPEPIRRHLDSGMKRLQGCYAQVVLRELQTLAGHPDRLHVWTRLAIEAAERYS